VAPFSYFFFLAAFPVGFFAGAFLRLPVRGRGRCSAQ
jgi:hypothetical protein